jgi:hypothetical protein
MLSVASKAGAPRVNSRAACTSQLTNNGLRELVHVMLVNFSQEEIVLPKSTVLGIS